MSETEIKAGDPILEVWRDCAGGVVRGQVRFDAVTVSAARPGEVELRVTAASGQGQTVLMLDVPAARRIAGLVLDAADKAAGAMGVRP